MTHPLEDYLAAAGESPSAFAARLGVEAGAIVRILGGGAPSSPVLARRIVEACAGAVTFDDLYAAGAGVSDLAARRRDGEPSPDIELLAAVIGLVLPEAPIEAVETAAEAAANAYEALGRLTNRRGPDRLVQVLRPVLEEIPKDFPDHPIPPARLAEAPRRAAQLYFQARERRPR
ncbi:hypothetical protein [Amphiplicatus metriothermophilus]|uniref:Uncharacterized protein n=1 Tax=Amphiplicatus metriothermophilus TaxID=1519374 RepID=A0A239PX67_9PROT|nr:hypothetical protein [Amphiplicatus metriothermophilus]MBB5519705.1 hypothetical protein [Amphiplicatus metriothermophilus]SNT74267.1 hypothetical protein SAMN06297382_2178 [Amphiplicatus metriothermophilus]